VPDVVKEIRLWLDNKVGGGSHLTSDINSDIYKKHIVDEVVHFNKYV
jgi:hypothetical protein